MWISCHQWRKPGKATEVGLNLVTWTVVGSLVLAVVMIASSPWSQQPRFVLAARIPHGASIDSLGFSPDGRLLASADRDGTVRLWDSESGRERSPLRGSPGNTSVAFSSDSKVVAIARDGSRFVRFWDADQTVERPALDVGASEGVRLAFSPGEPLLAVMHGSDGSVALWEHETGRRRAMLRGSQRGLRDFAFAPDGRILALAGWDGAVRLWETSTGQQVACIQAHRGPVGALAFSADGSLMATASGDDPTVRIWDVADGRERATVRGPEQAITGLAFSPSGTLFVATATDGGLRSYDTGSGRQLTMQRVEKGGAEVMAISPDGRRLATGGFDSETQVWDITRVAEIGTD